MIAYPAEYGESGVMTFIVNQNGASTNATSDPSGKLAPAIKAFDPGKGWKPVKPE